MKANFFEISTAWHDKAVLNALEDRLSVKHNLNEPFLQLAQAANYFQKDPNQISRKDIELFILSLWEMGETRVKIKSFIDIISNYFDLRIAMRFQSNNPASGLKPPKQPRKKTGIKQFKHNEISNSLVTFKSCGIMIFEPLRSGY